MRQVDILLDSVLNLIDAYSGESSVDSSAPYQHDQPIRDEDNSYYSENQNSDCSEPLDIEMEQRYADRFAGFREDPYGGHWSSPTQSEVDPHRYDRSEAMYVHWLPP